MPVIKEKTIIIKAESWSELKDLLQTEPLIPSSVQDIIHELSVLDGKYVLVGTRRLYFAPVVPSINVYFKETGSCFIKLRGEKSSDLSLWASMANVLMKEFTEKTKIKRYGVSDVSGGFSKHVEIEIHFP